MWSNVVNIDKKFDKEIRYMNARFKDMKHVSYAVEESRNRIFFYLASLCELQDQVETELYDVLETEFLSFLKLRHLQNNLPVEKMSYATCTLVCSLLHFDREYESSILRKILNSCLDYNIDGIMTFRLNALTENWDELIGVSLHLIGDADGDSDLYEVAEFITGTDNSRSSLIVDDKGIYNVTKKTPVETVNLFDKKELNMLSAVIREHPAEVELSADNLENGFTEALRKITRVIEK